MVTLRLGSKNEDVKRIQLYLGLTADGNFGPKTEVAVKQWQAAHGLVADGIVGVKTWIKMFGEEETGESELNIIKAPINVHITRSPGRPITYLVIHYTAGDINNPETLDKIKQVHRKRNYYQDIAYNFIIDRDGKIYKGRDTNVRNQGTSNVPWNMHTLAICYVGGLDKINGPKDRKGKPAGFDTRTPQQKASLVKLIKSLKKNFPTIVDVRGHKQVPGSATGCPGFDAHAEYQHLVGKEDHNKPLHALN
jgi:hypothetical protein